MLGTVAGALFGGGSWLVFTTLPQLALARRLAALQSGLRADSAAARLAGRVLAAGLTAGLAAVWLPSTLLPVAALAGVIAVGPIERSAAAAAARRRRLEQALLLPPFVDRLGIGLTAGLSLRSAVAEAVAGDPVAAAVWGRVADPAAAPSVAAALDAVVALDTESVHARLANALLIATERGSSLLATLDALSAEVRSETGRRLLEIAAKKDVLMMVPVVFGILPAVTAVAIYPALVSMSNLA